MTTFSRRFLQFLVFSLVVFFLAFAIYYSDGWLKQMEVPKLTKIKDNTRLAKNRMDRAEVEDLTTNSMEERTRNLFMACESFNQNPILPLRKVPMTLPCRVSISDQFKLLGCVVPKVGSTNIRRLIYLLDHLTKLTDSNMVTRSQSKHWQSRVYSRNETVATETQRKLQAFTKFMFVREPFERLVSAYRAQKPGKMFRMQTLQFEEFLNIVLRTPPERLDPHHKPFHIICKPCSVKYNFIGQINNFEEDMNNILNFVGAPKYLRLPTRNQTGYKESKSFDVVEEYKQNTSKDVLKRLYDHYYKDYSLFGFPKLV